MRVKPEFAPVIVLAAVGVALASGLLLGVAMTKATTAPERAPACTFTPETIRT